MNKELEIASNREISERRVVVLPLLIEDVALPGFLQGKLYGDFRRDDRYPAALEAVLRALGPAASPPRASGSEIAMLRAELEAVRAMAEREAASAKRAENAAFQAKSERLKMAIEAANLRFPAHAPINRTYAFEAGHAVVTLDYALWAIGKAMRKGTHILEALLTIHGRWGDLETMMAAYDDMVSRQ